MQRTYAPQRKLTIIRRLPGLLLIVPLLLACGSLPGGPDITDSQSASMTSPYLLSLDLNPGAVQAEVEESHGGTALVWKPGDFIVLSVEARTDCDACVRTLAQNSSAEPNDESLQGGGKIVDMNATSTVWTGGTSTVWSGGTSRVWSGGTSRVWSGGTSRVWSGGEFTWMPENTELWNQVGLQQGQGIAANLGYGVKVAIIDTGVDLEHPALREALAPANEWRDFYDGDGVPQEEGELFADAGFGHGTSVAGIVRQVAPRATILPLRVLGPDGQGSPSHLVSAIVWAVDHDADVINLSLGAANNIRAVDFALRYAVDNGVLVVSSTGDTRNGEKKVTFPASRSHLGRQADYLLSVTSVDLNDAKSTFATYHHTKVELAAPGERVFSPAPGERQVPWSGTSMSAPITAGALALALGERLAVPRQSLEQELKARSTDIYRIGLNEEYVDQLGEGRLDIAAFLDKVVLPNHVTED